MAADILLAPLEKQLPKKKKVWQKKDFVKKYLSRFYTHLEMCMYAFHQLLFPQAHFPFCLHTSTDLWICHTVQEHNYHLGDNPVKKLQQIFHLFSSHEHGDCPSHKESYLLKNITQSHTNWSGVLFGSLRNIPGPIRDVVLAGANVTDTSSATSKAMKLWND